MRIMKLNFLIYNNEFCYNKGDVEKMEKVLSY